MQFFVRKGTKKEDTWGCPDLAGKYHNWVCVIVADDPSEENIYIAHTEYFSNHDGWVAPILSTYPISPVDVSELINVSSDECSNSASIYYLSNKELKPKKKQKKAIQMGKKRGNYYSDEAEKLLKENQEQLKKNFEAYKATIDFSKHTIDELLWMAYNQGHLDDTPKGVELTKDEWERACFLDFVESCIENPDTKTKLDPSDYVRVVYPCEGHDKCIAWPDRCEDVGGDGENCCSMLVNLSKLCGVEDSAEKLRQEPDQHKLTTEEVNMLASILERCNK